MMLIFLFILGIFVGSFLNVLVDRLYRGEQFWKGHSYCEKCKKTLAWYDLVPLISFISLKGKCRYCHTSLSWYYFAVELVTGILFALTFALTIQQFSNLAIIPSPIYTLYAIPYGLFIVSCFIVIFFSDLKYQIIPDQIVFLGILISLFYLIFHPSSFIISLLSAVCACLFFLIIFLVTKGKGMGFGDVKLAFWLGLILGFPKIVVGLYLAFVIGAVVAIILVFLKKKKLHGGTISFGPFMVIGAYISIFWGEQLLHLLLQY